MSAVMNEIQLIKIIKAHIAKGEQHYVSAGLHLATLKERCPDQATFLALVKDKIGIGKSRIYELLQIADGRKTVEEIRADTAERQEKHRLSVSNGHGVPRRVSKTVFEAAMAKQRAELASGNDCRHAIADSGFDEGGAPIWICRGCGDKAPRSCRCQPCTATARAAA